MEMQEIINYQMTFKWISFRVQTKYHLVYTTNMQTRMRAYDDEDDDDDGSSGFITM